MDFPRWADQVVEEAAAKLAAAIPSDAEKVTKAPSQEGYVGRYVHFLHPDRREPLALWIYACEPGHNYAFQGQQRQLVVVGLKHDADKELVEPYWEAELERSGFRWQEHIDEYEGYRLRIDADSDDPPESATAKVVEQAEGALKRAGLLSSSERHG